MVTGIAAIHYFYMRGVWINTGDSPTVFRYVDWLLTVPLQIVEFYLILAAIAVVAVSVFWRLLIASIVMLVGGYLGEVGAIDYTVGFVVGMAGWPTCHSYNKSDSVINCANLTKISTD